MTHYNKLYVYHRPFLGDYGITNQLLTLFISLESVQCVGVVFVDGLYAQYNDPHSKIPFSNIVNVHHMNTHILNNKIYFIDLLNIPSDISFAWGNASINETIPTMYLKDLLLGKNIFDIYPQVSDPLPNQKKQFYINISSVEICIPLQEENGKMHSNCQELMAKYIFTQQNMSTPFVLELLKNIQFSISPNLSLPLHERYNVVHLRNENDAIEWWSRQNKLPRKIFEQELNSKYINLIRNHIPKDEYVIILTSNTCSNPVMDELRMTLGYKHIIINEGNKNQREVMAVYDLEMACKYCNSVLICPSGGSTFASLLCLRLKDKFTKHISFDLNNIRKGETIVVMNRDISD